MRFSLESGFNEDQFRWCFVDDDADAQGAAAAGADYGGGMSGSGQNDAGAGAGMHGGDGGSDNNNDNDDDDATWDSVVNDPDWGVTPSVSSFASDEDAQAQAAALGIGLPTSPVQAAPSPVSNGTTYINGIPVERRAPVSSVNQNYVALDRDYTQADLDKARSEYDAARDEAYSEKQFGFDLGPFKGPFGMYERIADAVFDPEAALANQMAERGYATYNGEAVPSSVAGYNAQGLSIADVGGPLSEGGRVAAYDPQTNAVYDTSPFANINPFGDKMPQEIRDIYNMKAEQDAILQAQLGGGGNEPESLLLPVEEPEYEGGQIKFPEFTPRKYEYEPYVGKFYTIPSRFTQPYGLLS